MVTLAEPAVALHLGRVASVSQAVTLTVQVSSRDVEPGLIAEEVLLERFQL